MNGATKLRIGCCENCGYVGYIVLPTKKWITDFYSNDWDKDEVVKKQKIAGNQKYAVHLSELALLNKDEAKVCDIGCGSGMILQEFEDIGFKKLIGVENSNLRSEFARKKYGYDVFSGSFESPDIAAQLQRFYPIDIFFSNHVLEHVYDPNEFIKQAASLQKEGGYLILSLPNFMIELTPAILFWLPHLHAFSGVALEMLLNKFGYELMNSDVYKSDSIVVLAKKVNNPKRILNKSGDYFSLALEKFKKELHTDQMKNSETYKLSWSKKILSLTNKEFSTSLSKTHIKNKALNKGFLRIKSVLAKFLQKLNIQKVKFSKERAFIFEPIHKRFTKEKESPIEIQFAGEIEMIVK